MIKPYYDHDGIVIYHGDSLDVMRVMGAGTVDAVVTDPPYGLRFMGKEWDRGLPGVHFWGEALRLAKPGAHLLAFGGTRTFHRLTCAIEDAGWEIRDTIMWVYGSGFPKSLNISKAIDRAAGAERNVLGIGKYADRGRTAGAKTNALGAYSKSENDTITALVTHAARQWQGWGTALKPAWEPIIVARKPIEGTVADNTQKYGTGAMNIDRCRVPTLAGTPENKKASRVNSGRCFNGGEERYDDHATRFVPGNRWPANLIHDGSDEVLARFPETASGKASANGHIRKASLGYTSFVNYADRSENAGELYGDSGSTARFFYCAKASKKDRDEGLDTEYRRGTFDKNTSKRIAHRNPETGETTYTDFAPSERRNNHPTVKPTALMRYLCRLVTPPGGVILDPFMGSGSTGKGARLEGFRFVGIEQEKEYCKIARARIAVERLKQGVLDLK